MRAFLVLVVTALKNASNLIPNRSIVLKNFHKISKDIIIDDTKVFCNGICANIKWASKLILKDTIAQVEPRYPHKIGQHQTSKNKR